VGHENKIIVIIPFSETTIVIWFYFFDNIFYRTSILLNLRDDNFYFFIGDLDLA